MKKLKIGILDLVARGPRRDLWARTMYANFASIMPQAIATWCEEQGHDVMYSCYTGRENDPTEEFTETPDLVIIGAYSQAAHLAYALSNLFRSKGSVTVLGGPHARCYPEDSRFYFDYVLGFVDKSIIRDIISDCSKNRPIGVYLSAKRQPLELPGVQERWKFIEISHRKAPWIKLVPMLGSMGCPYTCSFCIDSVVPYQPLKFDLIKSDLRFLLGKFKRPIVGWHDPNFGIRFDDYLSAIEDSVPPGSIDFIAESSLSILSEPHMQILKRNGFKMLMPGIESWEDFGNKSKTGKNQGMDKVRQVSEQVNMILRYVSSVQTNFIFGLDIDEGPGPFELTKNFLEMTPGIYPSYLLLTSYGQAAPQNLEFQRDGRVIPLPFYFLDSTSNNVIPQNYEWDVFYDNVIDLISYNLSLRNILKSTKAIHSFIPRCVKVLRTMAGFNQLKYYREIRRRIDEDPQLLPFLEGETTDVPLFYVERIKKSLGNLWEWLPEGALYHDPNPCLKAQEQTTLVPSITS